MRESSKIRSPSILSTYLRHLGVLLFVSLVGSFSLIFLVRHQTSPYFYADIYEHTKASFQSKEDLLAIALVQKDLRKIEGLISDEEFIENATSTKLYTPKQFETINLLQKCKGRIDYLSWGTICREEKFLDVIIPVQSAEQTLGYLHTIIPADISKWVPYARVVHAILLMLTALLAAGLILGLIFYRSMGLPIKKAMIRVRRAETDKDFEEARKLIPTQELQEITSILAGKTKMLTESKHKAELGEVAAQVAHDIRSPLMALNKAVSAQGNIPPAEQRKLIAQATARIYSVGADLLARLRGEIPLTEEPKCSPLPIVKEIVDEKCFVMGDSIQFEIETKNFIESTTLPVSKTVFTRIISNLLNNSVEALTGVSNAKVILELKLDLSKRVFELSISDNGQGLTPEQLHGIRSQKIKTIKKTGTGLGFKYTRKELRNIGGTLTIDSELKKGTRVVLKIPIQVALEQQAGLTKNPDLVLVDDDILIHTMWRADAALAGHNLFVISDPNQFDLSSFKKEQLIFIDKNLNGVDGSIILKKLISEGFQNVHLVTSETSEQGTINGLPFFNKQYPVAIIQKFLNSQTNSFNS